MNGHRSDATGTGARRRRDDQTVHCTQRTSTVRFPNAAEPKLTKKKEKTLMSRIRVTTMFILAWVMVLTTLTGASPPVRAQEVTPAAVDEGQAIHRADFAALAAQIDTQGGAPLIVGLDMPGYDPALFDQVHAAGVQEASIASAQHALLGRLSNYDVSNVQMWEYIPFMALTVHSHEGLMALYNDPDVVSVEEDRIMMPGLTESVPLVKADQTFDIIPTVAGHAVAVLDTGTEKDHPLLAGRVISEACFSTTNAQQNLESFCPNGAASSTAVDSGLPCDSTIDSCDHGSHVAGIVAGVAPRARIIAIQVFSRQTDNPAANPPSTPCSDRNLTSPCVASLQSNQISALNRVYALRNTFRIAAVNMSLGGGRYTDYCDALMPSMRSMVDLLAFSGIFTVASAGNNGNVNAMGGPACLSNIISVGATDKEDKIAAFSDLSNRTYMLAPGVNIRSATLLDRSPIYRVASGTSMAAPHVAGALAALKDLRPLTRPVDIWATLRDTGRLVRDDRDGGTVSKRRLDVYATVCEFTGTCDEDDFRVVRLGETVFGTINPANDLDYYYFNGTAGQRLSIRMNRTSGTIDPFLELIDPPGTGRVRNDNGGGGVDALINGRTLQYTGRYRIVARSVAGGTGTYALSVLAGLAPRYPQPSISSLSPASATRSTLAQDFWLAIRGSGFTRETRTYWGTTLRPMYFGSDNLIYLLVPGAELRFGLPRVVPITVENPGPGGGMSNMAFFYISSALLGESELVSPEPNSVVPAGIQQTFVISWTHPDDSWRTMQNMDLRLRNAVNGSVLASIRVVERPGTNSVYRLLNGAGGSVMEADGETPAEGLGGDDRDLEMAVGVYNLEFRVDGPEGEVQDDDVLGQFTITAAECPYPVTGLTLSGAETGVAGADYTYTANLEPLNASQPLTLTWAPEPVSGQGTSTAVYNWGSAGEQFVFASAENCGGFGADVKAVRIRTSETPDLSISKRGPAVAVAGETITYTLTISNSGAETATNLVVLDELPAGATHVSGGALVGNSVRWDLPELAGYGAVTETVVSVVANTTLTNTNYSVSAQGGYSASGQQPVVTRLVAAKTSSDPLSDAVLYTSDGSGRRLIDLTIPAGSVFDQTTFTLDELDEPGYALPDGLSYAGRAFRLGAYQQNRSASDLELGEAISLTVAYDTADAAAVANGVLGLYHWDGSQWTQEGLTCTTQSEQQHLACRYSGQRLTQFALAVAEIIDEQPVAGVTLNASTSAATAEAGTVVEYRLTVTNTGSATDSFVVTVTSGWSATLSTGRVGPLAPGASSEFSVTVTVPAEAADGESNVATVSAVSQADGSVQAQVSLTTTAHRPPVDDDPNDDDPNDDDPADQPNRLFLPAILSSGS
ncbi:MAG: hypothetical protein DCC55_33690 [Chloroflexi bacterium]|nr:MAG: hypothetical protein DCC55_33690 [Chloroflexota bacterium]